MPRRSEPPTRPAKAAARPAAAKPAAAKPAVAKTVAAKTPRARVLAAIRAIPAGSVAGYGVVARRAGLPGRARMVARILSENDDTSLPWHRVLRSDGRIAFPPDSEGHAEQTQRLRAEGVTVENGRVRDLRKAESDLDTMLWAPPRR
ncbi:MAG TPA: MGMT family protein [Xanthomonadaceae bacterium]|jgi:methylated-DNA-protein-cysteine methyltransferase-like protein